MATRKYRVEFAGREGPEPGVPNEEPWEVVDVTSGDPVERFATREDARARVRDLSRADKGVQNG